MSKAVYDSNQGEGNQRKDLAKKISSLGEKSGKSPSKRVGNRTPRHQRSGEKKGQAWRVGGDDDPKQVKPTYPFPRAKKE